MGESLQTHSKRAEKIAVVSFEPAISPNHEIAFKTYKSINDKQFLFHVREADKSISNFNEIQWFRSAQRWGKVKPQTSCNGPYLVTQFNMGQGGLDVRLDRNAKWLATFADDVIGHLRRCISPAHGG